MTVKSVIDIDVNDAEFKRFHALFQKYTEALKKQQDAWKKIGGQVEDQSETFTSIVKALYVWNSISKQLAKTEENQTKEIKKTETAWKNIARYTREASRSIGDNLRTLAKWTGLGTLATGLIGGGSIFGLDRLAATVSSGRRASLGLGTTYGQRQAFGLNYSRLVDPDAFLSGVNESLHDVSKRRFLYNAGLTESDIAGKSTGEVTPLLMQRLKSLLDRIPEAQLSNRLGALGLGQFGIGLQEANRIRGTSAADLRTYGTQYKQDVSSFDLAGDTQKKWQDFLIKLERAGDKIENVLIDDLTDVADKLGDLSTTAADTVRAFLETPQLKQNIKDFGKTLGDWATYLGSADFKQKVKGFTEDVGTLANAIHWLVNTTGVKAAAVAAGGAVGGFALGGPVGAVVGAGLGYSGAKMAEASAHGHGSNMVMEPGAQLLRYFFGRSSGGSKPATPGRHNPGNLRVPGSTTQFQTFGSDEEGIRRMAQQLLLYENRDKLNTIAGIVSKYAPANENDTKAYIKSVAARTGFGATEKIDLNDKNVLASVMSAMLRQEDGKKNAAFSKEVVVTILNNTGGNAIVAASQLPH